MTTNSIMIVGVGGQGTLLASKILGAALLKNGFDVKVSEVHGMSQRGGSVVTYIKYGDKVYSPLVALGEADIILSFEALETARWLPYLKKGGKIFTSDQQMDPMPVITGAAQYPSDIFEKISELGVDITVIDAVTLAKQAGSPKTINVILIGLLARYFDFDISIWREAINECVKPHFIDLNLKAFQLGYDSNQTEGIN